jgi:hypothetical protein
MNNQVLKNEDKRKAKRILTETLFVVIEDQVNLNFATLDYNAYGTAILTDLSFDIGDEITITIGSDDGFLVSDISTTIRNKIARMDSETFRYGLQFNYDERMSAETIANLKKLENVLA